MLSWAHRPLVTAVAALHCLLLAPVAWSQPAPALRTLVGQTLSGRVTTVVDGDTVDVRLAAGSVIRVRLEGVDAPERGAPFSVQARTATRVALFGQAVTLVATDVDRYQRLVARVSANGRDSSLALVQAGLACHFTRYSSDAALAAVQVSARAEGRGFWVRGGQRPLTCDEASAPAERLQQ